MGIFKRFKAARADRRKATFGFFPFSRRAQNHMITLSVSHAYSTIAGDPFLQQLEVWIIEPRQRGKERFAGGFHFLCLQQREPIPEAQDPALWCFFALMIFFAFWIEPTANPLARHWLRLAGNIPSGTGPSL